ncbi:F-box domain-containing protein [Mycena venus]|uniref:F-box domain-containing protein n=1 Tax=Mycena venus TaxID=2733690 RepID=A0A8H7CRH7_9AGAR|nr:F-box domain-containing protein [Mycena venus]
MSSLLCHRCGAVASSDAPVENPRPPPGTRYGVLSKSNEAPLDSEAAAVQLEISKTDTRLEYLATEITRLRARLKQLEEEHVSSSRYHSQNKAILSPLRRLPPEILGEIFSWTIPSLAECWDRERIRITDSPWSLTHVSRRWRAVAISNPSLWSLVAISYQSDIDPTWAYPLSMIETQIERAQKLNIFFGGCETIDCRPQVDAFQCLAKYSSRWEQLMLDLTSDLVPLLAGLRNRVPLLQTLSIQWNEEEGPEGVQSIDCFQNAPCLVDVGVRNDSRPITFLFPPYQLTHYDADGHWEVHRGILRQSPTLVEARITIPLEDEALSDFGGTINLLFLRRLFVSYPAILTSLRFPALEELAMDAMDDDDRAILADVELSIVRSASLRKLCFSGCPDAHRLVEILKNYPSIIELAIVIDTPACSYMALGLMQLLTRSIEVGSEAVVPELRRLTFGCSEEGWINRDAYLKMVTSHWNADHRALESASLLLDPGLDPDAAKILDLNKFREEGLDLLLLEGENATKVMDTWLCWTL